MSLDGDVTAITASPAGVSINDGGGTTGVSAAHNQMARSPEVRSRSALCMPNILCFKVRTVYLFTFFFHDIHSSINGVYIFLIFIDHLTPPLDFFYCTV